jgi:hypothetical protein
VGKGTSSAATSSRNSGSTGSSMREKNSWAQRGQRVIVRSFRLAGRGGPAWSIVFVPRNSRGARTAYVPPSGLPDELRPLLRICREGRLYDVERWIADGRAIQVAPDAVRKGTRPKTALEIALEAGQHSLVCRAVPTALFSVGCAVTNVKSPACGEVVCPTAG